MRSPELVGLLARSSGLFGHPFDRSDGSYVPFGFAYAGSPVDTY